MTSIRAKITQYFHPAKKEDETTRHNCNAPPPVLRAELQVPQPIIEWCKTHQHEDDGYERERSRIDRCRLWIELGTLVFAILGFGALLFTLCATWEAVVAARRDADAGEAAARIANQQMMLSERAWVGIGGVGLIGQVTTGQAIPLPLEVRNSGHTPALRVTLYAKHDSAEPKDLETLQALIAEARKRPIGSYAIPPEESQMITILTDPKEMTEQKAAAINSKGIVYSFGLITYKDIFGSKTPVRETQFCVVHQLRKTQPGAMRFCDKPDYNYMK